jgi:regulator of sigma E protease
VKIFGENPEPTEEISAQKNQPSLENSSDARERGQNFFDEAGSSGDSFQNKNRGIQAAVLAAGVFFNFLFAWALISLGFVIGLPAPVGMSVPVENPRTVITLVLPGSPAGEVGLRSGDAIVSLSRGGEVIPVEGEAIAPDVASEFIASSFDPITFMVDRGGEISEKTVVPEGGIIADRPAVGISMDSIGIAKLPPHQAVWHGLTTTWSLTVATAYGLFDFIFQAFQGDADLSGVAGPVGIVGMVGDVRELGFAYLLTFAALISINLAIINLLPIPALDGGRIVFVGIEAITRRRVPPRFFNTVNTVGFFLLILLMLVITFRDIKNLF